MAARSAALIALIALGASSLAFDLTLPLRLPSDQDWAESAGALRTLALPGDAVQIWPPWAERARLFVDAAPVLAEEDLATLDDPAVRRLWLLSLPRTPFFHDPSAALLSRGATPLREEQRFGALSLRGWDLHAPELAADLTRASEEHEVDYVARRCVQVAIGSRFVARGKAGAALHLRAGVIGERAYDANRPPILVQAYADAMLLGTLEVPRTIRDGTGWRRLDVAVPRGPAEREFGFVVSSPDAGRPFCLAAWTTTR